MNSRETHERCSDVALAELVTPYCFGDATEAERQAFELHLMECDVCWREMQRLEEAVRLLRSELNLAHALTVKEVAGLFGMSAALDQPFGGHRYHAIFASAIYALLYAIPVFVELAYRWDVYGRVALFVSPLVFLWMFGTTLLALAEGARATRKGDRGFGRALLVMLGATILLCAVIVPLAPRTPLVEASFQTYPVHLAALKSVFYAWWVGPFFVLWPYQFVLALQRELVLGRHRMVQQLLSGDPGAVPPPGMRVPRVRVLGLCLAGMFVFNWIGQSHLFDHLTPGPYANLFMALVMTRAAVWLGLPALCLWWYQGRLDELKREVLAVMSFGGNVSPR